MALSWNEIKDRGNGKAEHMEFLFELYEKYTAGLFVKEKKRRKA
jgi:hypothetical protein